MLEHPGLGSPLKISDKAYTSKEFITPWRRAPNAKKGAGNQTTAAYANGSRPCSSS
jgi:hypothetical protein